jgi:hypothetical protein
MQDLGIVGPDGVRSSDDPQLIICGNREDKTQGAIALGDEALDVKFHRSKATYLSPSLGVRLWIGLIQFGYDAFNA